MWTARAMAYSAHNHIPPDEVTLAVVIQEMIVAEASSVLYWRYALRHYSSASS